MKLEEITDTKIGETAIVMGNGESLNEIPQTLLSMYESFGVNHVYLCGITPTYYVSVDTHVLTEYASQIYSTAAKAKIAFLSSIHAKSENPLVQQLYALPHVCLFSKDTAAFKREIWVSGHTSVYVAIKMAYYLGFSSILLFGVDHD